MPSGAKPAGSALGAFVGAALELVPAQGLRAMTERNRALRRSFGVPARHVGHGDQHVERFRELRRLDAFFLRVARRHDRHFTNRNSGESRHPEKSKTKTYPLAAAAARALVKATMPSGCSCR